MPSIDFSSRYRSTDDASMRHRGTYMALKVPATGLLTPIYIDDVTGSRSNPRLSVTSITDRTSEIRMDDPLLVLERPELCMVNLICENTGKELAAWHETGAERQIKRSLDLRMVTSIMVGANPLELATRCFATLRGENRKAAVTTFYNKSYPLYSECFEKVISGRAYSMAFSERFALCVHKRAGVVLYYKATIVGYIENSYPVLLEQFQYLAEQLEESANAYV